MVADAFWQIKFGQNRSLFLKNEVLIIIIAGITPPGDVKFVGEKTHSGGTK